MRIAMQLVAAAYVTLITVGCSTLGPEANVTLVNSEIKANKDVGNIIVAGPSGTLDDGTLQKAIPAMAISSYGGRSKPTEVVRLVLDKVKLGDLGELITAPYQAEFCKVVEGYIANEDKKKKKPDSIELPSGKSTIKMPDDFKDPKQLQAMSKSPEFKEVQTELKTVADALKSGGFGAMIGTLGKTKTAQPFLVQWDNKLFDSLSADHILLTYAHGDKTVYDAKKDVKLFAALVNVKTGKFRYFVETTVKKGAVPTPYAVAMGAGLSSMFDTAAEKDELAEMPEGGKKVAKNDKKKKK